MGESVTRITTAEQAEPYQLRTYWVRMPRARNVAAYSAACPICGSRIRLVFRTGSVPGWGSNRFCGSAVVFAAAVLPMLPEAPPPSARQIKNRTKRR